MYLLVHCYSLGDQFIALDAYAPSGQDAFQPRLQQAPVETTVVELNKLDPFEDMVSTPSSYVFLFPLLFYACF